MYQPLYHNKFPVSARDLQRELQHKVEEFSKQEEKLKHIITKDEFAISAKEDIYKIPFQFDSLQNSCKSFVFKRVSMPCVEKIYLQDFQFQAKTLMIDGYKYSWLNDLKPFQIVTKQKNEIIAYHNKILLFKALASLEENDINTTQISSQEEKMKEKYSRVSDLVFIYVDLDNDGTLKRQFVKERKMFYYDYLRGTLSLIINNTYIKQYDLSQSFNASTFQRLYDEFVDGMPFGIFIIRMQEFQLSYNQQQEYIDIKIESIEEVITQKEIMFAISKPDDHFDPCGKLWVKISSLDQWDFQFLPSNLNYVLDEPFKGEIQKKYKKISDEGLQDSDIVLVQQFAPVYNQQQNIWLNVQQMNDFAPKYKKILMRREIEQNGYVNFTSQNCIDLNGLDWKISKLDFTIIPTTPEEKAMREKEPKEHQIVESKYYDYQLFRKIQEKLVLNREVQNSMMNPQSKGKQSQIHFTTDVMF